METFKWQSSKPGRSNGMQTTSLAIDKVETCRDTWQNTMLSTELYVVCGYTLAVSVIKKRSPEATTKTNVL